MIKRVRTENLQPGNFIHDFNCGWNGGNIFIDQTLIADRKMIDIIRSWGIKEVYIDTERGRDIDNAPPAEEQSRVRQIDAPKKPPQQPEKHPAPPSVPLSVEVKKAKKLRNDAVKIVRHTLQQVHEGKTPDVGLTYELARRMRASISRNRDALLLLTRIRKKDEYTLYHSISVSSLVLDMCNFKRLPEKRALDMAVGALFHDIGKTKVPHTILNKPAKLTEIEFHEMKKHVEYSVDLLQNAHNLPFECYDIALHHHEHYNGEGYPHGLKGENISMGAQLTAICDVFDAITSTRCYREGLGTVTGLKKIYELSNNHFNKDLTHEFIRCIGVYPIGSCVKLEDRKIGIVVGSTDNILKPIVKVFYDGHHNEKISPFLVDLSKSENSITSYEAPGRIGIKPSSLLSEMVA